MKDTCVIGANQMNQNYLSGLFLPAVAGLFFFLNRSKTEKVEKTEPVYSRDPDGLTGVAKYLEKQNIQLESQMANQDVTQDSNQESALPVVSSVSRYLEILDKSPVSGVRKYMLRQALAEKEAKQGATQPAVTGVAKYLKNQKPKPVLSGVAKYLKHQENQPKPSKVAKYVAKQALAIKQQEKQVTVAQVEVTGVEKYLKQQESLPQASRVAKYMAKQALLAKQAKQNEVQVEVTGVARYLIGQESLPQASRVAKYVARQDIASRQRPVVVETGVEKYMRNQP